MKIHKYILCEYGMGWVSRCPYSDSYPLIFVGNYSSSCPYPFLRIFILPVLGNFEGAHWGWVKFPYLHIVILILALEMTMNWWWSWIWKGRTKKESSTKNGENTKKKVIKITLFINPKCLGCVGYHFSTIGICKRLMGKTHTTQWLTLFVPSHEKLITTKHLMFHMPLHILHLRDSPSKPHLRDFTSKPPLKDSSSKPRLRDFPSKTRLRDSLP